MALRQVICHGLSRRNCIFRVTLVTLGSPGLRAGKSPAFLVLRGAAACSGWAKTELPPRASGRAVPQALRGREGSAGRERQAWR